MPPPGVPGMPPMGQPGAPGAGPGAGPGPGPPPQVPPGQTAPGGTGGVPMVYPAMAVMAGYP